MTPRKPAVALLVSCSTLALFSPALPAQTAPAPSAAPQETTVKLDPFSVSADSDVGFVAASSLAGGRIATALKDTPVAYSVLTKEFLEAFNVNDIADAASFSPNVQYQVGDGTAQGFGSGGGGAMNSLTGAATEQTMQIRGQNTGAPQRNFFPIGATMDNYNLDRVDVARGPNAVLFGIGNGGGSINANTKQALLGRNLTEVRLQIGSWSRVRATIDVNKMVTDKFAVRANAMYQTGDTWRQHEWEDRKGLDLAATYRLSSRFTIRGEVEYRTTRRLQAWTTPNDYLTGWDGRTYTSGINAALTASQIARAGIARWPMHFTLRPGEWGNVAINYENTFTTDAPRYNANASLTGYLNDKAIRTVGFGNPNRFGNNLYAFDGDWWKSNPDYLAAVSRGSPFFRVFGRDENRMWDDPGHNVPSATEVSRVASLYGTYTLGEALFVEAAADINRTPRMGRNDGRRGLQAISIDIDRVLPTGAPNPNFLKMYSDSSYFRNYREENYRNLRLQIAYVKETRFGKLQAGVMGGWQGQENIAHADTLMLPITTIGADARAWNNNGNGNNDYFFGYHRRMYVDDTIPQLGKHPLTPVVTINPLTGIRENITPRTTWETARPDYNSEIKRTLKFAQVATNLNLFKNRLVFIAAGRRDLIRLDQRLGTLTADYPAGWVGDYWIWLPNPPKDFESLEYTPKNAAGVATGPKQLAVTRPRATVAGVSIRQPQYANDRFQDDFSSPVTTWARNTYTLGATYNLTRNVGVFLNRSTTFNPTLTEVRARDYNNRPIAPTVSLGHDAGVRYSMPNGKLSVSVARFWGETVGTTAGGQTFDVSPLQGYTEYINVPAVGNLNPIGDNLNNIRFAGTSTRDVETWGYEFESTANLTPSWRLTANAGITYKKTSKAFTNVLPVIADTEPLVRKQLAEAGIRIDAKNVASIDPALNDPKKINVIAVQAAVDAWNTQHDVTIPSLQDISTRGGNIVSDTGWRMNFATDYRFREGRLAGLRVGVALNYIPPQILGPRNTETIRDPNNPNLAIDDPATDAGSYLRSPSYITTTGTLSYTYRVKSVGRFRPKSIQYDLVIANLDNNRSVIYPRGSPGGSAQGAAPTVFVPRSGDVGDPSRVLGRGYTTVLDPRNLMLTAKLAF
jgi:outer membrane receptor protein involved in Fe transport